MLKRDVCGTEIWECSSAEAKQVWRSHPDDREKIWTSDEIDAFMLSSPEEIMAAIEAKRTKPGKLPGIAQQPPASSPPPPPALHPRASRRR